MGRRKIPMTLIQNKSARNTTFKKRKSGLFKKAMELSILTGVNIRVIIDDNNKLHEYGSEEDPKPLLRKYYRTAHLPHETYTNKDYETMDHKTKGSFSSNNGWQRGNGAEFLDSLNKSPMEDKNQLMANMMMANPQPLMGLNPAGKVPFLPGTFLNGQQSTKLQRMKYALDHQKEAKKLAQAMSFQALRTNGFTNQAMVVDNLIRANSPALNASAISSPSQAPMIPSVFATPLNFGLQNQNLPSLNMNDWNELLLGDGEALPDNDSVFQAKQEA